MLAYVDIFNYRIPLYGVCLATAFILCSYLTARRGKKEGICSEDIIIISAVAVGMSLFCGGLLYNIVTYTPKQILEHIKNCNFDVLFTGGLVFYGGLIGGIVGVLVSSKILSINIAALERSAVVYLPLGHAVGRIGCLLAGCCYGFEYNGLFAVKNVMLSVETTYFPIQAVEALLDIAIMFVIMQYIKKKRKKYDILLLYMLLYAVMRFFTEFLRYDAIRGHFIGVSTSQWISICIIIFYIIRKMTTNIKLKHR